MLGPRWSKITPSTTLQVDKVVDISSDEEVGTEHVKQPPPMMIDFGTIIKAIMEFQKCFGHNTVFASHVP